MVNSQGRSAYTFCPLCGAKLIDQMRCGQVRRACPACDFVHFRDPKVAVIGLVLHQGQVLLTRRGVDPGRGQWALPGGFMDAGEAPETALRREVAEEVGLAVTVGRLLGIYAMTGHGAVSPGIVLAYLAQPAQLPPPDLRPQDDVSEAGWYLPGTMPQDLAFESTRSLLEAWRQGHP